MVRTQLGCTGCDAGHVLKHGECVDLSDITHCMEAADSRCTKCAFWHRPTPDGTGCEEHTVWLVILLIVLLCVAVLAALVALIAAAVNWATKRHKLHEQEQTMCVFEMERSNVNFVQLGDGLFASTKQLALTGSCLSVRRQRRSSASGTSQRGR